MPVAGSRNAGRGPEMRGHMLHLDAAQFEQNAGQLEQNAVTHLRLSKMRVAGCRS